MAKLRFRVSISLDGYTAGSNQSIDDPLGIGGIQLHQWAFPLEAWRKPHGLRRPVRRRERTWPSPAAPTLPGSRPWNEWITQYSESHQQPVNRFCHTLGIPLIALSIRQGGAAVGGWESTQLLFGL